MRNAAGRGGDRLLRSWIFVCAEFSGCEDGRKFARQNAFADTLKACAPRNILRRSFLLARSTTESVRDKCGRAVRRCANASVMPTRALRLRRAHACSVLAMAFCHRELSSAPQKNPRSTSRSERTRVRFGKMPKPARHRHALPGFSCCMRGFIQSEGQRSGSPARLGAPESNRRATRPPRSELKWQQR